MSGSRAIITVSGQDPGDSGVLTPAVPVSFRQREAYLPEWLA